MNLFQCGILAPLIILKLYILNYFISVCSRTFYTDLKRISFWYLPSFSKINLYSSVSSPPFLLLLLFILCLYIVETQQYIVIIFTLCKSLKKILNLLKQLREGEYVHIYGVTIIFLFFICFMYSVDLSYHLVYFLL